jgi:predicted negative regulator of RcsB-dependent stress response
MNPRPHSDTQTRLEGFEARLQDAFNWANEHAREIVLGAVVLLVVGGIASGIYEWQQRQAQAAETELAKIDADFASAMGSTPGEYFISEPANSEQATKARETSVGQLDEFIAKHPGTPVAALAGIKAAELEVDLGKLDAADPRLAKLADSLPADDARRAIALRLRAYTLDQRGQTLAAGETYEAAAKVTGYPPRALAWIEAGDAYSRAKAPDRAIAAYREVLAGWPELAEQERIVQRIGVEQAALDAAPPKPPNPDETKP